MHSIIIIHIIDYLRVKKKWVLGYQENVTNEAFHEMKITLYEIDALVNTMCKYISHNQLYNINKLHCVCAITQSLFSQQVIMV